MKRESLLRGFSITLIIGVLFGTAFFLYFRFNRETLVIENQKPLAYFDEQSTNLSSDEDTAVSNVLFGSVEIGDKTLDLTENAGYSYLKNAASVTHGAKFGDVGLTYLYVFENNISDITDKGVCITIDDKSYTYKYVAKYELNNETEVTLQDYNVARGVVFYYQKAEKYGISDKYEALVFEEVE